MPSKVLETVLTGRNLLSPVLVSASRDVEAFDAQVTAANGRAAESASVGAAKQETAAGKVVAANTRSAESASLASDKTVAANARAAESTRVFAEVTESSTARAGLAWARMATVGLPLVAGAVALVTGKMAGDYQQLVTKLETTAGETHANLAMVSQGMLDMAGQVGVSADELAKGMYTVESAGFHGADALKVLQAGAQGAKQEQADLSHVVDAVTTSLHDYHLPASDAAKVTSELVAAVSHGKTTFDDLTGSMHSIEPVAVGAHQSIAQTAGSLAAMTASGMHADQAAQNLAHTIGSFQNATKPMRDELSQLGLDATDLQQHMGERGIAGTLQLVADRIQQKIDPSGKLLLSALQTNKTAVSDLSIMIGKMPPQLADLASGLLAGTTSQKDFKKAAQDLGGEAGAMADQFIASYKGADGFSAALKSGGPMVQTYISALAKATGTSDGLRTALMLTGENAASTNDAIAAVAGAAAQADGSIRGWDEVQGNFNQKLAEAGAGAKTLAIEAGQHLLPVLTGMVGWVADTGIPGIEHLGSAVGDAVGWFSQLPGPVKEVAGALAALAVANSVGLFEKLGTGIVYARVLMAEFAASTKASMAVVGGAYREAAAQAALLSEIQGEQALAGARSALAGLGAAAGAAASGGMSALRNGASGLMAMFGGPWVVGIAAAGAAVYGLIQMFKAQDEEVQQGTKDVAGFYQSIADGGSGALPALEALQSKQAELAKAQQDLANAPVDTEADVTAYDVLKAHVSDLTHEVNDGTQKWQDHYNSLGLVDQKTADVNAAMANLQEVMKTNGAGTLAVVEAEDRLRRAQQDQKQAQDKLNQTTKTAAQLAWDNANAVLAEAQAGMGSKQAYDEFTTSLQQWRTDAADPAHHSAADLTREQNALGQSALGTAASAGHAGEAWAKASGMQDTSSASAYAQLLALQKVANAMGNDTPASVRTSITALQASVAQGKLTAAQMDAIAHAVEGIPDNQKIAVTADTSQAENTINDMLGHYRHIQYTGSAILVDGRVVANADGNLLQAYAAGGMSPMSSSVAQVVKPGTLRVIGDNPIADEAFIPINSSQRSMQILGETATRMGMGLVAMANGGMTTWGQPWGTGQHFPVGVNAGLLSSYRAALDSDVQKLAAAKSATAVPDVGPVGSGMTWPALDRIRRSLFPGSVLTSAYRPGAADWHGRGDAIDIGVPGNSQAGLMPIAAALARLYPGSTELIHNPNGSIKNGSPVGPGFWGPATWAEHANHVHWAMTPNALAAAQGQVAAGPAAGGRTRAYGAGGYTGDGPVDTPAGIVHGREFVMDAATTAQFRPLLEAMHAGQLNPATGTGHTTPAAMPGYGTPSFSGGGALGAPVNVTVQARVFIGDREITDIARVEATAVLADASRHSSLRSAAGSSRAIR